MPIFKGGHRWMAPELFNIWTEGTPGLFTRESDIFTLGMVTFEVRNDSSEGRPMVLKLPLIPPARCLLAKCHSRSVRLQ